MSGAGPEVLAGSNQRPERVSIPPFHLLQERTYLRHQTRYSIFLAETTILLCYKQADQQALDLVQVKVHDIRAFTASNAFYCGVLVDQIMQACHWKAHNMFTNFYQKDLIWSDNDNNMYLGPVVVAQQVLDPSPQTCFPRKEKKGGGAHSLQPSLQESIPESRYRYRYRFTFQDVTGKVIFVFLVYQVYMYYGLIRLSLISYSVAKIL